MSYAPSPVAARVTRAHKAAVWAALAPGVHWPSYAAIAAATGIDEGIVMEVVAMGCGAGRIEVNDTDRQAVWIGRRDAA